MAAAKSISEKLQIQFDNKLSIWLSNGAKDADYPDDPPSLAAISRQIEDLVNLTRCTLADVESIDSMSDMVEHFSIDCPIDLENILYVIKNILDNGEAVAISSRVIDFTDMIWLPYKWNLTPPSYDWILIDEAQDLNAAQLHLIKKMKNKHTRFIFVGDPNQAIYGFPGRIVTHSKE